METLKASGTVKQGRRPMYQPHQHTPGPWKANNWATGWTVSAPNSHYSVCHLADCNNAEANARLIAGAPELLAALKRIISAVEYAGNVGPKVDVWSVCDWHAIAGTAIDKATGG